MNKDLPNLIDQFLEYLEIDPTQAYFSPFHPPVGGTARRALWRGKEKIVQYE